MATALPIFRPAVREIMGYLQRRPRRALVMLRVVGRLASLACNTATQSYAVFISAGRIADFELRVETLFISQAVVLSSLVFP